MDYRGYSRRIIDANKNASDSSLGVLLGRYCISRDISAMQIAEYFKVSKMTVYRWFTGVGEPSPKHEGKIQDMLRSGGWA
jgi:hypothetical protein